MTREIKFRAWNPIQQELEYYTLNDLCYNSNRPDICLEGWQEYTGFADMDGKEIYEGDILKRFKKNGEPYMRKYPVIHYSDEELCGLDFREEKRVIGNIYENPELLEENND